MVLSKPQSANAATCIWRKEDGSPKLNDAGQEQDIPNLQIYWVKYVSSNRSTLEAQSYDISRSCVVTTATTKQFNSTDGKNFINGSDKIVLKEKIKSTDNPIMIKGTRNGDDIPEDKGVYTRETTIDDALTYVRLKYTASATSPESTADDGSACPIKVIGWLVCPVMRFLAGITDNAYGFIESQLQLTTGVSSTTGGAYKAWERMRNLSNIGIGVVFLIIIFSQISGLGISNYGIKKMLPRLIVGVVLLNASFWLCAYAVDISNVVGANLKSSLTNLATGIYQPDSRDSQSPFITAVNNIFAIGTVGTAMTAAVIAAGPATLSALAPVVLGCLIAVIVVFLILVARQALVILLIAVAPLAFLAYLLPNTEKWFTKWRKTLVALLIVYPMTGLVFGACAIAAAVVRNS